MLQPGSIVAIKSNTILDGTPNNKHPPALQKVRVPTGPSPKQTITTD